MQEVTQAAHEDQSQCSWTLLLPAYSYTSLTCVLNAVTWAEVNNLMQSIDPVIWQF